MCHPSTAQHFWAVQESRAMDSAQYCTIYGDSISVILGAVACQTLMYSISGLWPILLMTFYTHFFVRLFNSYKSTVIVIATKCCTCPDSTAVVACAKFCSDLMMTKQMTANSYFHLIGIVTGIILSDMVPWFLYPLTDLIDRAAKMQATSPQ